MKTFFLYLCGSLFLLTSLFCGCKFIPNISAETELEISLPKWPPENSQIKYPQLSRWLINIDKTDQSYNFYTNANTIFVTVSKNKPVVISAYPITITSEQYETSYFKPAGLIYPFGINTNEGNLSWEQGFPADIMHKIILSKKETGITEEHLESFLCKFNWQKAIQTIEKKISNSITENEKPVFNPWQINSERLLDNLCYGSFKATFLNDTGTIDFNLDDLDIPDNYVYFSPFIPENYYLNEKKKISFLKNEINLLWAAEEKDNCYIFMIKSSKNVSKQKIHLPIFIEEI